MKIFILVTLAVLSCVSATSIRANKNNGRYVVATVLFYSDDIGNKVVASGKVSRIAESVVKKNLKLLFKNTYIRVVPIYQNYSVVPPLPQVYSEIRRNHNKVLTAKMPEMLSSVIVHSLAYFYQKMRNGTGIEHYKNFTDTRKILVNDHDIRIIPEDPEDNLKMLSYFNEADNIEVLEQFLPNSIYYSIQLKDRIYEQRIQELIAMLNESKNKSKNKRVVKW